MANKRREKVYIDKDIDSTVHLASGFDEEEGGRLVVDVVGDNGGWTGE